MHLGINGWPPVASHMACLVLGVALTHLSRGAGQAPARIPKRGIVLSLPAPPGDGPRKEAKLEHVHVLAKDPAATSSCRLTLEAVDRLPTPGWTLVFPLASANDVPSLVKAARGGAIELVDEGRGRVVTPCGKGPKVTYGTP